MHSQRQGIAVFAAMACLFIAFPASGDELEQTRQDMEASRKRHDTLERQNADILNELADIQQQLVKLAGAVQKSEKDLSESEEKLRILSEQLTSRRTILALREKRLSALVRAALRLSRMPPEAMIMMPGDADDNMKAARTLKMSAESIRKEVEAIRREVAELKAIEEKITAHRDASLKEQKRLTQERKTLEARLGKRKALHAKLDQSQMQEAEKIAQLARKSEDLRGLVDTLRTGRTKAWKAQESGAFPSGQKGKLRSFASARGHIRPPMAGRILTGFGIPDGNDGTSKGMTVAARENAQVVAPFDGEVVFTGPFLNYGKLVIIRHSDDFHTLLAGLAKINVSAGEFLLEGEPIGAMGSRAAGNRLYVELRKNNQPIDPEGWIEN